MDADRFDALSRSLTTPGSRRRTLTAVLGAAFGAALGLGPAFLLTQTPAEAGTRQKKLQKNQFGCVNVGKPCRGKDGNCCSGICQGKKPKKGEKDTSKCVAHDASTCQRGQQFDECGGSASIPCTTTAGVAGECTTTTGNAAYCFADGDCFPCRRDTDCEGVCGKGAACIRCAEECAETGGTACVGTGNCTF